MSVNQPRMRTIPILSSLKPKSAINPALLMLAIAVTTISIHAQPIKSDAPGITQPTILYGVAYYNEYMPAESDADPALRPARLEKDVAMMQAAGINVVRMGESTWSLWEPEDGHFEYAWMDHIVAAMAKANIKVILGTPTYSLPTWMVKAHPEVLIRPQGGGEISYGMRQNMDFSNPIFRRYAQRMITNLVTHYRDNPAVIGWQIDNETNSYGAFNQDVFEGFVDHLKKKFRHPSSHEQCVVSQLLGPGCQRLERHAHPRPRHQHQL